MNDHNKEQQLRYLEEVCIPLHRAGFKTQPLDESQLPVHWNGAPLCRITGKGSVFYRREDVDTPLAEDALLRVEDIAARTMEYMTVLKFFDCRFSLIFRAFLPFQVSVVLFLNHKNRYFFNQKPSDVAHHLPPQKAPLVYCTSLLHRCP